MIFDTHAHYDDAAFDEDREEVIGRFGELGIGAVTDPGSTMESLDRIIALVGAHANIYGALGIHPSECAEIWRGSVRGCGCRRWSRSERSVLIIIGIRRNESCSSTGFEGSWISHGKRESL